MKYSIHAKSVLFSFLICTVLTANSQILYDDFDTDSGNWNTSGSWAVLNGTATDSPAENYANNSDSTFTLAVPLDLSSAAKPALSIHHRYFIEALYDSATIEASTDGGNSWETLQSFSGNAQFLRQEQIDLSGFAGESSFLIRFHLQSDDSVVQDGWYIDTVIIDEIPGQAGITSVTNDGLSTATVTWSAPSGSAVQQYKVYRALNSEASIADAVLVGTTDSSTLSVIDYAIAPKSTFYYLVQAIDANGLYSISDEAGITIPAGMDYPFLDDGNAGATRWQATGSWGLDTDPDHSENSCWSDSPGTTYTNSSNTSLTLVAPVDLSSASRPVLAFQHKHDLLTGDILSVEISTTDGEEWTSLQSFSNETSTNTWTQENISLADYIGEEQVLVRFLLTTTVSGVADGVWLDNIAIAEAPSAVTFLVIDEVQSHSVRLSWPKNNDLLFSHYAVYREKAASGADFHSELAAEIPSQSQTEYTDENLLLNTDYAYRVYAVSSYKTLSIEAQEASVLTANHPAPFSDDFENGTNGWVLAGSWNIETNESGAFLCDSPYSPYENSQNDSGNYARTAVDLSSSEWPVLTFSDKFSFAGNDRGYLQISKDGSSWSTRYAANGERTDWRTQQIDLSEWAGEANVRIRFYLYSDSSSTADGWAIDNLSVAEHVSGDAVELPIIERFEDGAAHWINGGWTLSTNTVYEGAGAARSLPIPFTPAYADIYATYGRELNLAGSTDPQLTLWARGIDDSRCRLHAQLSSDGGISWTDISGDIPATPDDWTRFQFDVPDAFKVDGVRLRLRAYTYYYDRATEFYVDKLTMEETPNRVTLDTPTPHRNSIDLSWSEFGSADTFRKYEIYRRDSSGVSLSDTLVATITNRLDTSFTDTGLSIGKTYYYKVYVYNLNDTATPSNEGQATTVPVTLPISDSFDDLAQWDTIGSWNIETNESGAFLCDSPYSPYENSQNDSGNYALTAVDLSSSEWPVLTFSDKFSFAGNDRGYLQISKDGSSWSTRYAANGERTDWRTQQIDLSEWAGEANVRIRFYLYSDSSSTADGWAIDNLSVAEHVSGDAVELPIIERFEDGAAHWINGGWTLSTNTVYEGAGAARSLPIPFTPAYADIYATYGRELNLAGSTDPQLTLWARGIDDSRCRLHAQLSSDGGISWTDISGDIPATPDDWNRFQFDVPDAFLVDGVRLHLRAYTYYYDRATEFYVDKLTMEETPTWVTMNTPVPSLKSIDLSWSEFGSADTFRKYEIYRRDSSGVSLSDTLVATITNRLDTSFTDTGLSIGKTYYYKVYVYNLNDTATPSNEGQATTVPVTLPISDSFDDLAQWDTIGSWNIETNESGAFLCDSPYSPYENSQNDSGNYALTAVDLSSSEWPVLTFSDKFSFAGNDRGYLQISKDGSSWSTRYAANGERTDWRTQQIDLSEWAGEANVRIRFYLYSDSSSTADGWAIDNLSVAEHVSGDAVELPIIERFEDGAAHWINGGWTLSTNTVYEGAGAARSLPIPFTPAYADIYATYGRELNLAGSTDPQLTLWARGIDDSRCRLHAQLSSDGGISWTDISGDIPATPDDWNRFQFDVPDAFLVDGVRLRLRAYTYYYDRATEFYVDKLTMEETPTWVTMNTPVPSLKSIDLSWSEFGSADTFRKYEIYRRDSSGVSLSDTLVATITNRLDTSFTDTGLSIGKTYYYKVYVYNLNDTATPSNEGQATTVPVTLPISDSFDDLAQWDTIGSWNIETNESGAFLCDSPYSPYENSQNDSGNYALTAVDLSSSEWPVLTFSDKFSFAGNDRGYLQISKDGSSWSTRYAANGERTDWRTQQIDLSEWAGEANVRIRFYLYSDSSSTADGWAIDNLSVAEHVSGDAVELPIIERFEDGAAHWINGGWTLSTNTVYEGAGAARSLPIPFTPAYADIYATYGRELNLAGSTDPQLTLWARGIDDSRCRLHAQLSSDGGISWTDISGDIPATPDDWNRFQFDVPDAFLVDGVRLRLRAYTYYYDRATEFYVDRLAIGEETPSAPVPLSPADGSVVQVLNPTLTVENAIDILDDNCSYEFEIYTNANLSAESLVRRLPVQAAGDQTTSWQVDVDMIDGLQYWWRSRATSSSSYLSDWSVTNTFHVVIVNNPPSDPFILSPYASANLPDADGSFIWVGSADPDATDYVAEYRLEVADDEAFDNILMSATETNDGVICARTFSSFEGYENVATNQAYFWRVCAVDSQGLASGWVAEPFVYGTLSDIVSIDPVTITEMTIEDGVLRLGWSPTEYAAQVEFTPTLSPADWQPVEQALNIQTNYVELNAPTDSSQGFYRVIIGN